MAPTSLVQGKKAIQDVVISVLTNTKSTVQVIIPNLTDLPLPLLSRVKKTSRVLLACKIDNPSLLEMIKKNNPNIEIRNYEASKTFVIVRDSEEEGVLGTNDELIYTTNKEFIAHFKDIFQSIWPRATRTN